MEFSKDPPLPKPSASDPYPAGLVYGFPENLPPPAPCALPVLMDRAPSRGNCGSSVSTCPEDARCVRTATQAVKLLCSFEDTRCVRTATRAVELLCSSQALFLLLLVSGIGYFLYLMICFCLPQPSMRLFLSGMYLSSFDESPSSRHLNGTWHIDFSLVYYNHNPLLDNSHISCDSAAVSVYYKGAYLVGTDLHAFKVTKKHPIRLKVHTDASRSEVQGWLTDGLMEDRRLGIAEFEVQFVAKYPDGKDTFLCRGLRLGFSTTEEVKLMGDGNIRCPLVA